MAIDPGPTTSGWVLYDGAKIVQGAPDTSNAALLTYFADTQPYLVAIEWVESYGMAVGKSVFETCWQAGVLAHAAGLSRVTRVTRREVKLHLCGHSRAKDANVRQALIDRFGGTGGKRAAVGLKKSPGPLYGCRQHMWSALAVAVTFADAQAALSGASRESA